MLNFNFLKETSPEAKLVLFITRWVINNQDTLEIKDLLIQDKIKWKIFKGFIIYHELFPFSYPCLKKYSYLLPNEQMELFEKSYYYCLVYLSDLWEEFKHILVAFRDKNIASLPLKGIAFIADNIYADKAYLRPMCDIDLLIKEKDLLSVEKALEALEYKKDLRNMKEGYWRKKNYHLGFIKEREKTLSYNVEMHWALDYKRDKPILPHLWDRIKKAQIDSKDVYLLSPEDMLFCLALHQRRFGKILCLKNVCDIAMLLNRYNANLDWDYVLKEAEAGKMRTTLYFILTQTNLLLDSKIPPLVLKALDVPKYKKRLIKQFILQNTLTLSLNNGKINMNSLYLKSHFLLYDNLWEPVKYILNVPQEQFAKFYGLRPYTRKTDLFYRIRYLYFINNFFIIIVKIVAKRLLRLFKKLYFYIKHSAVRMFCYDKTS